jgi:hypothetical protein
MVRRHARFSRGSWTHIVRKATLAKAAEHIRNGSRAALTNHRTTSSLLQAADMAAAGLGSSGPVAAIEDKGHDFVFDADLLSCRCPKVYPG